MPDQGLRLLCPQYRLPGSSMSEKWEQAAAMGFDGIELSGPATAVQGRLAELHEGIEPAERIKICTQLFGQRWARRAAEASGPARSA